MHYKSNTQTNLITVTPVTISCQLIYALVLTVKTNTSIPASVPCRCVAALGMVVWVGIGVWPATGRKLPWSDWRRGSGRRGRGKLQYRLLGKALSLRTRRILRLRDKTVNHSAAHLQLQTTHIQTESLLKHRGTTAF